MRSFTALLSLALTSLLLPFLARAQFNRYTSGPIISHTFDSQPDFTARGNTSFIWSPGGGRNTPHGLAYFNGNNSRLDLLSFQDENGRLMPRYLPQTLTLEFWAMYQTLGFWSRLFDCGNGEAVDNVFVSNMANGDRASNDLHASFHIGNRSESTTAANSIYPNTYQHFVATITRALPPGFPGGGQSAYIELYVDGILRARQDNAQVLNANVPRSQCWLGHSNWRADQDFRGYIDDFFYYDYPLSSEAVLAHFVLNRPPVYELTFNTDPRLIFGYPFQRQASFFSYNWTNVDERDGANVTKYHDGHLVLAGDSFIDLAAPNDGGDQASVGAAPIPVIGGVSGGDGSLAGGWSFEILFKADTVERWAKVFDCGNGKRRNNIVLGYEWESDRLRLEQYIGQSETFWSVTALEHTDKDVWYHVVVVFERERYDRLDEQGRAIVYVNGNMTANVTAPMPLAVQRSTCYIGKSHWEDDEYFDMYLDAFRLYDYALQPRDVDLLYTITHTELPTNVLNGTSDKSWHSGPVASYTFSRAPNALEQQLGTHYNHTTGSALAGTFPHVGIATFDGVADQVNLAEYDTDQGGLLPMVGGSMSIEAWVRYTGGTSNWQRIIDLGGLGGFASSNILLSAGPTIDELVFEVYSGVASTSVRIPNAINKGEWMHIVAVAEQRNISDSYTAASAVHRIYINGQYISNGIGYLPPKVYRPSSWIARSNWYPPDSLFEGQIDAVYLYDRALDYEEVAAHYISYAPPVFELAFARDPRPWLGLSFDDPLNQPTYEWEAYDPRDQQGNATNYHNGHLVLNDNQYVNLSTTTGQSSIGTLAPTNLFSPAASLGGRNGYPYALRGWSIELTFKPITIFEAGAKIFDFGNGPESDNVGIQWSYDAAGVQSLSFYVYRGNTGINFPIAHNIQLDTWYHLIVTMAPTQNGGNPTTGQFKTYINGELGPGDDTFAYPRTVERRLNLLGGSSWVSDQQFDMKLDTFRIYNYVVVAEQAERLYRLTTDPLQGVVRPLYQSDPFAVYGFNVEPDYQSLSFDTSFEWLQGSGQHVGLAHFNGVNQYINLLAFPDDKGQVLPTFFGNTSLSIEAWVRFDSLRQWSRLFDFGNGIGQDNILLGNEQRTNQLALHVYSASDDGGWASYLNTNVEGGVWRVGEWQHVVVTIEDMAAQRRVSRRSASSAEYTIYVNGVRIANSSGILPARAQRQFSYIANSNWYSNGDELFNGTIDSLYVYNYALSEEQVNVRYRLPKFPIFDLSFSTDPRTLVPSNGGAFTYSWQAYDPSDNYANNELYHSGHLVLDGSANSYVNLSAPQGPSSVGLILPRFGGESQGIGLYSNPQQLGWSFEFIVKINQPPQTWAKLIDWGNGAEQDNIILGFREGSAQLDFEVWNPQFGTGNTRFAVIDSVVQGFWYHIVVVVVPTDVTGGTANYLSYVDGRFQRSQAGYLPRSVKRNSAFLGKSNWQADGMFAAAIDAIRVYDYALSADNVAALYALSNDPNGTPRPEPGTGRSSSSSTGRAFSSSSVRRVSSSSSTLGRQCPDWAGGPSRREPNCRCPYGGTYPRECYCPYPYDTLADGEPAYVTYDCEWVMDGYEAPPSSSTGASGSTEGGMNSATIAAIIFAVVLVAAIAAFVYYRYFRAPATTQDILGIAGNSAGGTGGKERLLASTDVSRSHLASQSTNGAANGNGAHATNGGSQPTGLDYYLAPDTHAQPQSASGGVELPAV